MNNNDGQVPGFEKFPGSRIESAGERAVSPEQDFAKAFESGVPEFAGEVGETPERQFGVANPENAYYGEADRDTGEEYDAGIADAAALINYGLNAAARELGVETVVQKIKGFDASGSADPIKDFYEYLGVDTPEEANEMRAEDAALKAEEQEFREGVNGPVETRRSVEGAFKAIGDMKELIAEVEGADPRYEELRAGARAAGKGYFEYAVSDMGVQGLTELFGVLAQQREKAEDSEAVENIEAVEGAGVESVGSEVPDGGGEVLDEGTGDKAGEDLEKRLEQKETLNPEILRPDEA